MDITCAETDAVVHAEFTDAEFTLHLGTQMQQELNKQRFPLLLTMVRFTGGMISVLSMPYLSSWPFLSLSVKGFSRKSGNRIHLGQDLGLGPDL